MFLIKGRSVMREKDRGMAIHRLIGEGMLAEMARSAELFGTGGFLLGSWKQDNGSYVFRGDIDIHHTVYESIQAGKLAFVAIGPHYTVVGARRGVLSGIALPECMSSEAFLMNIDGYLIYKIEKGNTSDVVKFLPGAVDDHKKRIKKLARKIRKQRGKYSGYPETKVLVY